MLNVAQSKVQKQSIVVLWCVVKAATESTMDIEDMNRCLGLIQFFIFSLANIVI